MSALEPEAVRLARRHVVLQPDDMDSKSVLARAVIALYEEHKDNPNLHIPDGAN